MPCGSAMTGISWWANSSTRAQPLASCPITITEIYAGMRPHEEKPTRAFMRSLLFFGITSEIAERAGLLKSQYAKRGRTLSFQDASITAVCIAYGCTLVTENVRDFPMPEFRSIPYPVELPLAKRHAPGGRDPGSRRYTKRRTEIQRRARRRPTRALAPSPSSAMVVEVPLSDFGRLPASGGGVLRGDVIGHVADWVLDRRRLGGPIRQAIAVGRHQAQVASHDFRA